MEPSGFVRNAAIVLLLCAGVSCSDGGNTPGSAASDGGDTAFEGGEDEGDLFTLNENESLVDDDGQPVEPVVESLPAVAETGVPGIDSADAFCRSWSTYAGSVQAISLAWALQPSDAAASLEVAATDALARSVEGMAANLPTEIDANRQALTIDVPGPFLRRAERARQLLVDAGLADAQIVELGDGWIDAIASAGIDSENLTLSLVEELSTPLTAAAAVFVAELPSVLEDPSLDTTQFDIGPSLDYIALNCPDQGTLAGNDDVGSGGA